MIDVLAGSGIIDVGNALFNLSGFLGGFDGQGDNAVFQAFFRDASNATLGTASIGPVTLGDRAGLTGLLERSTSGQVPLGTRTILVELNMIRFSGFYNDGYADNLSLVLTNTTPPPTSVPEPSSTLSLLALGTIGAASTLNRKQKQK